MDIYDFVGRTDYERLRLKVKAKEKFEYIGESKEDGTSYKLRLSSGIVRKELAESVWGGESYLIHFSADYSGRLGYSGKGYATKDYSLFDSWDTFRDWLDGEMKHQFPIYHVCEAEQMCLF